MLQLRHTVPFVEDVMPNIGLLWNRGLYLDGLILCQNGEVPFSKLVLSCHSNLIYQALTDNGEDQVILLKDFSVSVVRGVISLLHGSQLAFTTNKLAETEELLDLLEVSLSDRFSHLDQLLRARRSRKRKINDDEDDVVITFDQKNIRKSKISDCITVGEREVSLKEQELKKRRTNYHTKTYTDWSKVAAEQVIIKEEPIESADYVTNIPIIQKVTYEKKIDKYEDKDNCIENIRNINQIEELEVPYRLRNRSGSLEEENELVVDLSFKRKRRSSGKSNASKSSKHPSSLVQENCDSKYSHIILKETDEISDQDLDIDTSEETLVSEEKVQYVIGSEINIEQEELFIEEDQEYEPAIVEEQRITTVVIDNEVDTGNSDGIADVDSSILIHTLSPSKVSRRNKSLNQTSGFLKTEDEAKSIVAPYIARVDCRPPKYRCLFRETDTQEEDCDYINSRLLMTQCHVYKHLDIYIYQCNYCELKCRLETNFEKHLNTHGVTRRREKMGKYIYIDGKSEFSMAEATDDTGHSRFQAVFEKEVNKAETSIVSTSVEDNCQQLYESQTEDSENVETIDNIEKFMEQTSLKMEQNLEKDLMERIDNLPTTQTLMSPEEGFKMAFDQYFKDQESNLFLCKICLENKEHFDCERESVIRTHIFKHLNIFIYECKFCGELFKSKQLLKCHNDHVHCKTAEEAFSILDEVSLENGSKNYSQLHSYHTSKKAVFLGEEKARSIISSYIVYNMRREQDEMDLRLECSLCQYRNESEIEVYEHIAIKHLNIYQYKCDFCSMKVKIKRHLIEHMLEKHGLDQLEEKTEMVITQSEDGSLSYFTDADKSEIKALDNNDVEEESAITLNVPVQLTESFKENNQDSDDFPYAEHNMTVKVGPNGSKKVFVGDAKFPLLRLNRSVLTKLSKGKLLSKKQADEMVFGYTIHNAESKMYECTLCNGAVQKEKSYLIQRHLYDHFNIYFLKCEMCNDIFRFATQFKDHLEAHKKVAHKTKEELVKKKANHMKDKIGNYHEKEDFSFIPAEEAKDIVESYYAFEERSEDDVIYQCKLCDFMANSNVKMYNHCLKQHLKIYQHQCDLCDELFKLDIDLKRHYMKIHRKKYQKNVKLDKLAKADKHYESLETDFPDVDISKIPMDQLKGKKISTKQAKCIKGSFMIFNESTKLHECELCDYKREWRGNLQFHVLAEHYDVYLYKCPSPGCETMLRNWSAFQTHQKSHQKVEYPQVAQIESTDIEADYHLLKESVYVGEEQGWKIARGYHYYDTTTSLHQCKMCQFSSKSQQVSVHVLAKHLPCVYLYRCQYCGKDFRYSRVRWREHLALHREGKVKCEQCPQNSDKVFTKESLKAHIRRNHTLGRFTCGVAGCGTVFTTKGEVRAHEKEVHLIGLPAKCVSHVCEWCDYAFPTRSRWKKHVILCQRGTSRTGFRKQISDVLQWLGKGAYKCTFCGVEFHPEADNVTRTGLPEARNHVATVHGMKHMRKAKMQWHGDPKHYNKEDLYRDKTMFWNQKVKDIEKVRNMAQQESKLFSIQNEVNENIAEAAKSHKAMMDALGYPDRKDLNPNKAMFMKLVHPGQGDHDLEPGQLATLQPGEIVEDGLVEHQVVVNIVTENGEIEQRQVILDPSSGTQTLIDQSQLYFDQDDIETGDADHELHHEVVFENTNQDVMLQPVGLQSIERGYKPGNLLEQNVEFSDVGSIQIVDNVDDSNMEYVEVPPQ